MPFPTKIQNAPQVEIGLSLYFSAFLDLTTCRPGGMGLYPIPWREVFDYGKVFSFNDEQMDDLLFFIRKMDEAWIGHWEEKQANKNKGQTKTLGKTSSPRRGKVR